MTTRNVSWGATVIFTFLLLATPLSAHHAFTAEYDGTNCATVTGTLTKIEWENPHAYFHVDAKETGGSVASWAFETVSIGWLKRVGTARHDFEDNIGKNVTVRACMAKNGVKNRGAAETVKLEDGRTLTVGTDYEHPGKAGEERNIN
jgi:hypothetical protein